MPARHGLLVATILAGLTTAAPAAAQPIEPLGSQLRLTQVGPDGSDATHTNSLDIAYNSVRDE